MSGDNAGADTGADEIYDTSQLGMGFISQIGDNYGSNKSTDLYDGNTQVGMGFFSQLGVERPGTPDTEEDHGEDQTTGSAAATTVSDVSENEGLSLGTPPPPMSKEPSDENLLEKLEKPSMGVVVENQGLREEESSGITCPPDSSLVAFLGPLAEVREEPAVEEEEGKADEEKEKEELASPVPAPALAPACAHVGGGKRDREDVRRRPWPLLLPKNDDGTCREGEQGSTCSSSPPPLPIPIPPPAAPDEQVPPPPPPPPPPPVHEVQKALLPSPQAGRHVPGQREQALAPALVSTETARIRRSTDNSSIAADRNKASNARTPKQIQPQEDTSLLESERISPAMGEPGLQMGFFSQPSVIQHYEQGNVPEEETLPIGVGMFQREEFHNRESVAFNKTASTAGAKEQNQSQDNASSLSPAEDGVEMKMGFFSQASVTRQYDQGIQGTLPLGMGFFQRQEEFERRQKKPKVDVDPLVERAARPMARIASVVPTEYNQKVQLLLEFGLQVVVFPLMPFLFSCSWFGFVVYYVGAVFHTWETFRTNFNDLGPVDWGEMKSHLRPKHRQLLNAEEHITVDIILSVAIVGAMLFFPAQFGPFPLWWQLTFLVAGLLVHVALTYKTIIGHRAKAARHAFEMIHVRMEMSKQVKID